VAETIMVRSDPRAAARWSRPAVAPRPAPRGTSTPTPEGRSTRPATPTPPSETFAAIDEAVGKLLARQGCAPPIQPAGAPLPGPKRICFVGLENKSAEELGDFKDQICQIIDTRIVESKAFQPISPRFVSVGLKALRLRPEELFLPDNQRKFLAVMEQQGQPFDYLLFATLTSGTTTSNKDYQRDYLLTLEMVNIQTGEPDKEHATIRKGITRPASVRGSIERSGPNHVRPLADSLRWCSGVRRSAAPRTPTSRCRSAPPTTRANSKRPRPDRQGDAEGRSRGRRPRLIATIRSPKANRRPRNCCARCDHLTTSNRSDSPRALWRC
jgi:hypothetical protein